MLLLTLCNMPLVSLIIQYYQLAGFEVKMIIRIAPHNPNLLDLCE